MEQRCFNDLCVSIYRLLYKKFLLTMIKIRKPIKPSTQDLRLSRRHWVPSPGGWRHRAPSQESLRSLGRRVSQTGLCAPKNQPRRERKKERKTRGPKLWLSKGALLAEMQAYISLVRWLLSYYTGWNFINSHNMNSLIHTRSLTLKRVTACLIPWPQSWELHAALLILGIGTDKEQRILEK